MIENGTTPLFGDIDHMCLVSLLKGYFVIMYFCVSFRYVSIKPDNRKLANGTNVLGLLIDTLLMEGFHLVSTRTVCSEDKTECYSFERIQKPEVLTMNKMVKPETAIMSGQSNKDKWSPFSFGIKGNCYFLLGNCNLGHICQIQPEYMALFPTVFRPQQCWV